MLTEYELNQLKKVLSLTSGFWVPQDLPDNDFYLASLELEKQGLIVRKTTSQDSIFFTFTSNQTFPQSLF